MRFTKTIHAALAAAGALAALLPVACAPVGPDYRPPETKAPEAWTQAPATQPSNAAAQLDFARWWTVFNDPLLAQLIDEAITGNRDIAIARSRIAQARAERRSALSVLLPEVSASGGYSRVRSSENTSTERKGAGDDHDNFRAGFDATWELDVFGGGRRGLEAADADLAATREQLRDVTVTLVSEVARNYVELRSIQRRLDVAKRNIETQRSNLALTAARVKAGLRTELEVARAEAILASTRAAVPAFESAAQQTIHRISVLLGNEPAALNARLLPAAPLPTVPDDVPAGLPSDLLRRRPDIRRAERELAAATARIGLATAELFPRVSLTGATGLESIGVSDFFTGGSRYWAVGPTVRWPFLTFGRVRANIDVKNQQQQQAALRYEQTVLGAFEDVENALVALGKEREQRVSLSLAVESNRRAVAISTELYSRGLGDFLAVLDAERSLLVTEDQLVQSDRSMAVAMVALYKALGGGWAPEAEKPATQ